MQFFEKKHEFYFLLKKALTPPLSIFIKNTVFSIKKRANQLVVELVGGTVVSPAHQSSNPRFDIGARIFVDLFQAFRRCAFSGRRRSRRRRGGDFVNFKMMCRLSIAKMLIGIGCACV